MVFKKLLAGLGFGGVEVDTVLSPQPATADGQLSGQVNLRAKSDTDITSISLILVATGPMGEVELGRFLVAQHVKIASGASQAIPFSAPLPPHTPFTAVYGQVLPGVALGVRTEVSVASGSAKSDFDPVRVDASAVQQHIMDALGTIGCKFARTEIRPGAVVGVPAPAAQAITFYAPVPEGQQLGPHIPLVTFTIAGTGTSLIVIAELANRPGNPDRHELTSADLARLEAAEDGWTGEVDRWLVNALERLSQPAGTAPGAFLQQTAPMQPAYGQRPYGHGPGQPAYAYGGHHGGPGHGYRYSGYHGRPSMAGAVAAGVGGAALGFLGGMLIGDMIGDAFSSDTPDVSEAAAAPEAADTAGFDDAGMQDVGYNDYGGGDFGGGDFGGGDFGGGDFGGGDFGGF